jgi:hypothetical protein
MNKISFGQLESARKNPTAFAKSLKDGGSSIRFKKPPKFTIWKNAVYHYHKEKNNLSKAINYFQNSFLKHYADNRRNELECANWILELQEYANNETKERLTCCDRKVRVNIDLTSKLRLGGELPLIKMNNKGGYSIYFFSRESTLWEDELRFPVIQNYVASTLYNVNLNEVEVGIYSLNLKNHLQRSYSKKDINEAVKELNVIGKTVSLIL